MFIDYTAIRALVGSGVSEIETDTSQIDRMPLEEVHDSVSMSGVGRETQLDRLEYKWTITTIPVSVDDLPRWREFSASVAGRELFTIDMFGTKAVPDDPISVSYIKGTYKENRFSKQYMTISFEVLER